MNDLKANYELALQKGENFILNMESIKNCRIDNTGKEIKTIDDLILVRKTGRFPKGFMQTPYNANATGKQLCNLNLDGTGKIYELPTRKYRKTLHFCLNAGVESHSYGNWDSCKYAILMPLSQMKEHIVGGLECDIFAEGDVPITENTYILCPQDEIEKMKTANPLANVVGYEGDSVTPYVNIFLSQVLGYKYKAPTEKSTTWDSGHSKDHDMAMQIFKDNGWEITTHTDSKWDLEERYLAFLNQFVHIVKTVLREKVLYEKNNIQYVKATLISKLGPTLNNGLKAEKEGLQKAKGIIFEIAEKIKENTGLDLKLDLESINLLEEQIPYNVDKATRLYSTYQDFMLEQLSSILVNAIREQCLLEKEKNGILTEEESILLQGKRVLGIDHEIDLDSTQIKKYETLLDRDISSLSEEELQTVIAVQNIKLSLLNKQTAEKKQSFQLQSLHEITPEQAEIYKQVDEYVPVRKKGLYLKFGSPNKTEVISSLTGIDLAQINNLLNSNITKEELYQASKAYCVVPNSHFMDFEHGITDCDLLSCKTVRELSEKVMKYAHLFHEFYEGKKVEFDKDGNQIEQFSNSNEHLDVVSADSNLNDTSFESPKVTKEELLKSKAELQGIESQMEYSQKTGYGL